MTGNEKDAAEGRYQGLKYENQMPYLLFSDPYLPSLTPLALFSPPHELHFEYFRR